mmetsp:Transcript_19513/g.60267  ORF Transcript_19513/g.60267 Transcript_19513/m.60267 type:complete len:328 (+) Transcript_19513:889-1872(+)
MEDRRAAPAVVGDCGARQSFGQDADGRVVGPRTGRADGRRAGERAVRRLAEEVEIFDFVRAARRGSAVRTSHRAPSAHVVGAAAVPRHAGPEARARGSDAGRIGVEGTRRSRRRRLRRRAPQSRGRRYRTPHAAAPPVRGRRSLGDAAARGAARVADGVGDGPWTERTPRPPASAERRHRHLRRPALGPADPLRRRRRRDAAGTPRRGDARRRAADGPQAELGRSVGRKRGAEKAPRRRRRQRPRPGRQALAPRRRRRWLHRRRRRPRRTRRHPRREPPRKAPPRALRQPSPRRPPEPPHLIPLSSSFFRLFPSFVEPCLLFSPVFH